MNKIIIGITHGDINGIGYEVILKTLSDNRTYDNFTPVIYGSAKVASYYKKHLDIQGININIINNISEVHLKKINLINCVDDIKVDMGISTPEAGKASLEAIQRASEDLENGHIHAVVTAPINKNNIQSEHFKFPGHTEYFEQKFNAGNPALMILVNDVMRVAVVTGHLPLKDVASKISKESILDKLRVFSTTLKQDFSIVRPRIAILGLNPHAGDGGVIGKEESEIIIPAINDAQNEGIVCVGPYPADGFFGAGSFKKFDGILAMYHDQGLIPFKTIAMETGVNFTAGTKVIRTSPDHGTAYDIVGKNMASEESFRQALFLAFDVLQNRTWNKEISANPLKSEARVERGGRVE